MELMTGRETLRMFAELRGLERSVIDVTIKRLLSALGLTPHADKNAGEYSGGNKRKLSLGIALIGDPSVLFIDEASSGMDPVARRKMWDLLSHLAKNRSVVLTTHSMEEAEALCTRIAIMVSGRMRCLGSPQHLKTRYLDGYSIDIHCHFDADDVVVEKAKDYILSYCLPGATIEERHGRFLRFSVKQLSNGLGGAFSLLQEAKVRSELMIMDYSIMQASLEQVFITLAKVGDGANCGNGMDLDETREEGVGEVSSAPMVGEGMEIEDEML